MIEREGLLVQLEVSKQVYKETADGSKDMH